jgi:hypothetical protein
LSILGHFFGENCFFNIFLRRNIAAWVLLEKNLQVTNGGQAISASLISGLSTFLREVYLGTRTMKISLSMQGIDKESSAKRRNR